MNRRMTCYIMLLLIRCLQEEYEDEEGEGGDGTARKKRSRHSKKTIFEVFEPSELERGHMTDVDQEIRSLDIPERFHVSNTNCTNPIVPCLLQVNICILIVRMDRKICTMYMYIHILSMSCDVHCF